MSKRTVTPADEDPYQHFDHIVAAGLGDLEPRLHAMHDKCPVGHSTKHGGFWLVTDHTLASRAARETDVFSSSTKAGPGPGFPYVYDVEVPLIGSDGSEHRDYRGPLQKRFGKAEAEKLAPRVRWLITRLIDDFIETGEADLVSELTIPVPSWITGDLLDIPLDARPEFVAWAQEMVAKGPEASAFGEMTKYVQELYEMRKESPGEDVTSMLLDFEINGRPISAEQWVGVVLILIQAGLDTTANGAALMLHYLAEHPETRQGLIDDPESLSAGIEELLRLTTPVPQHSRGVQCPVELGEVDLDKGDVVLLHWWAANRDEAVFPEPDEYRTDRSPNRHLAFSDGPHRCLGAHIARVELRVMFEEVLRRLPDYEIVEGGVERYESLNRGMSHLRVKFPPGKREGTDPAAENEGVIQEASR